MAGAPPGNDNAAKGRLFGDAVRLALMSDDRKKLRAIAEKITQMAADGDKQAIEIVRDSVDGKPKQDVGVSGAVNHNHQHVHAADEAGLPALASLVAEVAGEGAAGGRKKAVPH